MDETNETPKKRRGRPKGSKNKTTIEVEAAPTNGDSPKKRGRRKKTITESTFDPGQLTFEQVVATVKYAQDKIGDLSILNP